MSFRRTTCFRKFDQFRGTSVAEFDGWLRATIRNEALNTHAFWETQKRNVRQQTPLGDDEAAAVFREPPRSSGWQPRRVRFGRAILTLSPDQQEVVR